MPLFRYSAVAGDGGQQVTGELVAANFDGFLEGTLQHPINVDEHGRRYEGGTPLQQAVWTATSGSGAALEADCNAWTSGSQERGTTGNYGHPTYWTEQPFAFSCDVSLRLYCIGGRAQAAT